MGNNVSSLKEHMPFTYRMMIAQKYATGALAAVATFGGIYGAIHEGKSPIMGSIVACGVGIALLLIMGLVRKAALRKLERKDPSIWLRFVVFSILCIPLVFGIFWLKELMREDIRKAFWR